MRCQDATYAWAVRRLPRLLIVMPHFVEVVLVQLANKTGEVAVLEMFREDVLGEFLVLRWFSLESFQYCILLGYQPTSSTTKLSPSFPHLTTLSSCGFSSILV